MEAVNLIVNNCITYNGFNSELTKTAQKMLEMASNEIKQVTQHLITRLTSIIFVMYSIHVNGNYCCGEAYGASVHVCIVKHACLYIAIIFPHTIIV